MNSPQSCSDFDRLLTQLRLGHTREVYKTKTEDATQRGLSHLDFLMEVVREEANAKEEAQLNARLLGARFPEHKTLDDFDFTFQTSVQKEEIAALSALEFVTNHRNVVFVGPPGVGKTHLATALGMAAIAAGHKTLFTTAANLVDNLNAGTADGTTKTKLKTYAKYDVVIVDELGYLQMPLNASNLFFQFVSQAYRDRSLILTSNRPFQDWGEIFSNSAIAAATLDRLLHDAIVINLKGQSYRLKGQKRTTRKEPGN